MEQPTRHHKTAPVMPRTPTVRVAHREWKKLRTESPLVVSHAAERSGVKPLRSAALHLPSVSS